MSNHSLIPSPPPELMEEWRMDYIGRGHAFIDVATKAVQWGADHELEACCEWLERNYNYPQADHPLRTARRPKPPSLKEQALKALTAINSNFHVHEPDTDIIRAALEALDD